jgi:type I restriction enzyme S subunit
MTALLIDNLPLLAGAPNGIKKLRELILELAVRGKLVPQDPSDEPASKLLKRIAEEKARLVAEGKIKKQKPLAEVGEEAVPFELPAGWKWSSLAQVAFVNPRNAAADSFEVSFVPMTFIGTRFDDQHGQEPRLWGEVKQGFTHFAEGDIGVAKITPCFENSKACVFSNLMNGLGAGTTELHIVRPANGTLDPRYVLAYLKSPQFLLVGETKMTGTAGQKRLPKDFVEANPFPLPPLAEQHRIVAKVDELMALCDRLEAQKIDAESAHAQLVKVLLESLTRVSDATEFAANWQCMAEHFHILFTTESSIDALKKALLQLAVMGKLVQHVHTQPVGELISEISMEKQRLINIGALKKSKHGSEIPEDERPFFIPKTWSWVRLDDIATVVDPNPSHRMPKYVNKGVPFISTENFCDNDEIDFSVGKKVETSRLEEQVSKFEIRDGAFAISRIGTIGKTRPLPPVRNYCLSHALCVISPYLNVFNSLYLRLAVTAENVLMHAHSGVKSIGVPDLGVGTIRSMPIPVPPRAEQDLIVAKVDQLMALCNQLKTCLSQARKINEQLASTLVERALTKDNQQTTDVTDRKVARTLLAAEITHRLHSKRTFGQRKLQKVIYLAEHAAKLSAIQGAYLRDAAGPHDRQLMAQIEGELQNRQWYERFERETVGHAYRSLSQAGQHRQAYSSAWSVSERSTIEQVIELMRDWDTDRCEMTVTLYAAWNDFILEGRPVSDEAIVDEVMHSWNDTKLRFGKTEWLAVLAEMKKHKILMPTGFGKRTTGGMLSLPGFE